MIKKLIFTSFLMLLVLLMSSCEKDEPTADITTYTFKYNAAYSENPIDVMIFEYNDKNERVGQQSFRVYNGYEQVFTANKNSTKTKVRMIIRGDIVDVQRWVQQVFYLDIGGNINIEVHGKTVVGQSEP